MKDKGINPSKPNNYFVYCKIPQTNSNHIRIRQ